MSVVEASEYNFSIFLACWIVSREHSNLHAYLKMHNKNKKMTHMRKKIISINCVPEIAVRVTQDYYELG